MVPEIFVTEKHASELQYQANEAYGLRLRFAGQGFSCTDCAREAGDETNVQLTARTITATAASNTGLANFPRCVYEVASDSTTSIKG